MGGDIIEAQQTFVANGGSPGEFLPALPIPGFKDELFYSLAHFDVLGQFGDIEGALFAEVKLERGCSYAIIGSPVRILLIIDDFVGPVTGVVAAYVGCCGHGAKSQIMLEGCVEDFA